MSKLTIGFVLDDGLDSTDGVQQYVLDLGRWLCGQGHDVHYLVGETKRTDIQQIHSLSRNVATRFNKNRGTMPLPASRRKIKQLIGDIKFDVLHVQVPYSPFMAGRVIARADKSAAVIGTFHVLPHSRLVAAATRLLGLWLMFSLKRFDKMLAVSSAAKDYAKKVFGVDCEVLPNVIEYQKFNLAMPFSEYENKFTILFLGRLVPRKGCMTLLEAIAKLKQSGRDLSNVQVVICGKGPDRGKLEEFVSASGIGDIVEFKGYVSEEDKPGYYASANLTVFPSSGGESFGIVLLEAMASGETAVLAGDNPGYQSVMGEKPELLFPVNNSSALADKIKHFMDNDSDRSAAAQWGEKYAAKFDVATIGAKLVTMYEEILLRKR